MNLQFIESTIGFLFFLTFAKTRSFLKNVYSQKNLYDSIEEMDAHS